MEEMARRPQKGSRVNSRAHIWPFGGIASPLQPVSIPKAHFFFTNEWKSTLCGVWEDAAAPVAGEERTVHKLSEPGRSGLLSRVVAMTLRHSCWRGTFQAVPMLRAQGDCDNKSVSCSLHSKEIKVNLSSLKAG